MGFVGLLKFALLCFDFLAWPIFALGCPLYASVRVIETNSNSDMRNLVAYWIIFSLISLFELAFVRLIDWLPFWPYMKLLAIFWLVVPHFNGACYAYECLLRPCLSVNPRVVVKYLIKPEENPSLSAESFLAVAERYVKENGSEALEKLIDSKSKHTKPNTDVEEMKAVTNTEKKETAAVIQLKPKVPNIATTEWVNCVDTNLTQIEKKTVGAGEIKEKTVAAACGENKVPEIPTSEKVQREWTCDLCQVKTTNEKTLNHHLQGKKHKAKCEKLNVSKQANKNKGCSTPKANDHEAEKPVFSDGPNQSNTKKQEGMVQPNQTAEENVKYGEIKEKNPAATTEWVNCVDSNLTQIEKKTVGAGEIKEKTVAEACGENKVPEIPTSEKVQREWTCDLCQVKTTNEKTLDHHLQGKKHKAKCEKLNVSKQANKNKSCSTPKANDHEADKPVFSDGPNQSNTKKQEGMVQPNQTAEENVKYGEIKEKNPAATTEWVNCVDSNLTQIEKKTVGAGEIKEKTVAEACGENKVPEIPTSEKVQREWTCDLCQVKTTNEKTLDHHLQGKKHKAKCEKLNVSKQANKNQGCSTPKANDHEAEKPVFSDRPNQSNTKKQEGMVQPNQTAEPCKPVVPKFWCSLCDVKCLSEIDLASHINGQKHLSSLQSMIDSLSRGR
ncbi:uncharacterized protein LOC130779772 isoform X3 [Actinidia eriantha]|uniref:uncharacterized protein LOC130779772 isoform X3 n=1 Tax=Actinidia eriantha TaxID=165200 RepID=UPI00258BED4C|nr:uncharacterized protein LOC130779772 isoform X3 [Actinidia eriantha]